VKGEPKKSTDTQGVTTYRHADGRQLLNYSLDGLHTCFYTKKRVAWVDAICLGAVMPNIVGTYICSPDAAPARQAALREFEEFERNCNTCKHLERIPTERSVPAVNGITAWCSGMSDIGYKVKIQFHPDDHMQMKCWAARSQLEVKAKEK
jgi:hypothetical protein